jgi:hypothetical protein
LTGFEPHAPALLQSNLRKQAIAASAHSEKSLTKVMAEGVDLGHDHTACPPISGCLRTEEATSKHVRGNAIEL